MSSNEPGRSVTRQEWTIQQLCRTIQTCSTCLLDTTNCVWCGNSSSCIADTEYNGHCVGRIAAFPSCPVNQDVNSHGGGVPAPIVVILGVASCIALLFVLRILTYVFRVPPQVRAAKPPPPAQLNMTELENLWPALRPIVLARKNQVSSVVVLPACTWMSFSPRPTGRPRLKDVEDGSEDSSDGSCMICLVAMEPGDECRQLVCDHLFHKKCIDEWLTKSRECPMCRQDVEVLVNEAVSRGSSPKAIRRRDSDVESPHAPTRALEAATPVTTEPDPMTPTGDWSEAMLESEGWEEPHIAVHGEQARLCMSSTVAKFMSNVPETPSLSEPQTPKDSEPVIEPTSASSPADIVEALQPMIHSRPFVAVLEPDIPWDDT